MRRNISQEEPEEICIDCHEEVDENIKYLTTIFDTYLDFPHTRPDERQNIPKFAFDAVKCIASVFQYADELLDRLEFSTNRNLDLVATLKEELLKAQRIAIGGNGMTFVRLLNC